MYFHELETASNSAFIFTTEFNGKQLRYKKQFLTVVRAAKPQFNPINKLIAICLCVSKNNTQKVAYLYENEYHRWQ